jgi:TonB family protein
LLAIVLAGAPQGRAERPRPVPPAPCVPGAACCAWKVVGFCRVGCPPPNPSPLSRPAPDLTNVGRPLPPGAAILEISIDGEGRVVSACVLRGLRRDFDAATQQAALQWRFTPQLLNGMPVGAVMTVTFVPPAGEWSRPAVTPASALPITKGRISFVAPDAPCPSWEGKPVRLGPFGDSPLLEYVEPRAPSPDDVSGTVIVEAVVAADGKVMSVKPLRGVEPLTGPAVEAVRRWRFARTCVGGTAVPLVKAIALRYYASR